MIDDLIGFLTSFSIVRFLCGGAWVKLKSTGRWHSADAFHVGNELYFRVDYDDTGKQSSFHCTFNDVEEYDTNARI